MQLHLAKKRIRHEKAQKIRKSVKKHGKSLKMWKTIEKLIASPKMITNDRNLEKSAIFEKKCWKLQSSLKIIKND